MPNGLLPHNRPVNGEAAPAETKKDRNLAWKIERCLIFMLQHLDERLAISALSAHAGLSPSYFYTLFKEITGFSPGDFLIRARMQRAGELLREPSLKVKEVAALLGYRDQFYFSRQFKAVTRLTPSQYRDMVATSAAQRVTPLTHSPFEGESAKGFLRWYVSVSSKITRSSSNGGTEKHADSTRSVSGFPHRSASSSNKWICSAR